MCKHEYIRNGSHLIKRYSIIVNRCYLIHSSYCVIYCHQLMHQLSHSINQSINFKCLYSIHINFYVPRIYKCLNLEAAMEVLIVSCVLGCAHSKNIAISRQSAYIAKSFANQLALQYFHALSKSGPSCLHRLRIFFMTAMKQIHTFQ